MSALTTMTEDISVRIGNLALVQKIEGVVESLSPRDRKLLIGLMGFFLILALGGATYLVDATLDKREAQVKTRQSQLTRIQEMVLDNQSILSRVERAEQGLKSQQDFIIQSYIEKEAEAAGIEKSKLPSIQVRSDNPGAFYKETLVEVELKEVTLASVVQFLHSVEYGTRPIHIRSVKINPKRRTRSELGVNIEMAVVSLVDAS